MLLPDVCSNFFARYGLFNKLYNYKNKIIMKKVFVSVVAVAMSVMAMATEEAYVTIRLTGASGASSEIRLTQDDARTPEYESGYDSDKMMYQANSKSVLLYGIVGTQNCEDIMTNNLDGLKLGFVTNNIDATGYTLKFEDVSGLAFKLYDKVTDQLIDIVDNGTYVFDAAVGRVAVNDRFEIRIDPALLVKDICFRNEILSLTKYDGATVEVFADGVATAAVTKVVAGNTQFDIDLSALASGKYKVVVSGIATPEEYIIDVKPAVTIVP